MPIELARYGLTRIAVAAPEVRVADVEFNVSAIELSAEVARQSGASLCVFPELAITGYTCGDLFYQDALLRAAEEGLERLLRWTARQDLGLIVGMPVRQDGHLFNTAVVLAQGNLLGVVPKTWLPDAGEFYEPRWFSPAASRRQETVRLCGQTVPFGEDLLFRADGFPALVVGIELCEDLWAPQPPSGDLALAGANVLVNLSASPELLGKAGYRRQLVAGQSARCLAAYAYAAAGPGESSTDLVFSGHCLLYENGQLLAETQRFNFDGELAIADFDVSRLNHARMANTSFSQMTPSRNYREVSMPWARPPVDALCRTVDPMPFVPADTGERNARCEEIVAIQSTGLAKRLKHTGVSDVVIGLSGGLDSTLALLVVVQAFDLLGLDRAGIHAITMPGFGTTDRTRSNAERLAGQLGCQLRVIPIEAAVRQHFHAIGHDEAIQDVTYENSQARERTQLLMDIANQVSGLVIGTGDLSELALGWCTYNGDHMSMYAVNAGVPKTLVRFLVEWCADHRFEGEVAEILKDVVATPVSPELLPPDESGEIVQKTEEVVGPYELHDFFLYHLVRLHAAPDKILLLAEVAFSGRHDRLVITKWLKVFLQRFFSQQFKRSCLPDGPKVGTIALSPRGDWRMPSDASVATWIKQLS